MLMAINVVTAPEEHFAFVSPLCWEQESYQQSGGFRNLTEKCLCLNNENIWEIMFLIWHILKGEVQYCT